MELRGRLRPLVLAVDDVEDGRVLLELTLPLLGFDVVSAADGVAAVEQARAQRPDVILMDICMPRLDGYGALSVLRSDPTLASIPVVAFTAKADDEERARGAGFTAWCTKPCPPDQLAQVLHRALAAADGSTGT